MSSREPEFLRIEDIAEELQVNPQTVRQWIHIGRLAALKAGSVWRVRRSDLDAFLATAQGESTEAGARRDPWAPQTPPFAPRTPAPSPWEAKPLIRPGEQR